MCVMREFMSQCTHLYAYAWLPTYMYTYMPIYTIYTYSAHNNSYQLSKKATDIVVLIYVNNY